MTDQGASAMVDQVYQSYAFPSATGEGIVQARLYRPSPWPNHAKHILLVQIIHGMAAHMGRYDAFCRYLSSKGHAVCIHDQAGHGLTAPEPGRLGYFGPNGSQAVLDDIRLAADEAISLLLDGSGALPDIRRVIFGHSMGSFISRCYAARPDSNLAGAVFSGTSGANPAVKLGLLLASISIWLRGHLHLDTFLASLTGTGLQKRIQEPRTPYDWLSRDPGIVDAYMADPLCGFTFTAAGYRDLYTWLDQISRPQWPSRVPVHLPILLISGSDDPVGQYGAGPRQVRDRLAATGHTVSLKLYEGGRHEMHNEINRGEVWHDLAGWLASLRHSLTQSGHSLPNDEPEGGPAGDPEGETS